jgi:hypothetical protein
MRKLYFPSPRMQENGRRELACTFDAPDASFQVKQSESGHGWFDYLSCRALISRLQLRHRGVRTSESSCVGRDLQRSQKTDNAPRPPRSKGRQDRNCILCLFAPWRFALHRRLGRIAVIRCRIQRPYLTRCIPMWHAESKADGELPVSCCSVAVYANRRP